jgi:hypothetical protein
MKSNYKKVNLKFLLFFIFINLLFIIIINYNFEEIYGLNILEETNQQQENQNCNILKIKRIKNNRIEIAYDYQILSSNDKKPLLSTKTYHLENRKYRYKYNNKNQIINRIEEQNFCFGENKEFLNTFEYNEKGQLICIRDENNKKKYIFEYNNKNQIVYYIDFYKKIKTKFKYNKKNQLKRKILKYYDHKFLKKEIFNYEYNNKNLKTKKIFYGIVTKHCLFGFINFTKFKLKNVVIANYEYNNQGLKIRKQDYKMNSLNLYTYQYFNLVNEQII